MAPWVQSSANACKSDATVENWMWSNTASWLLQAALMPARVIFLSAVVLENDGAARDRVLRVGEACSGHGSRKEPHRF